MSFSPGERLGPYEIIAPLGAGGMGEVYRARDPRLGREVALKVLPAEVAADAERLRRFEQEARAVSALNHPNIVTLHEFGQSERGPYLVLEKVEGSSLRELLRAGALPVRRTLALGAQIAEGLAKAHAAGIVHRDLKPENIMVSDDGFAKILDFGLAKLVYPEPEDGRMPDATTVVDRTASGMILGTLGYLSPEQASGKAADFRADQFALGVLLYEMATGERPFRRATTPESLAAIIREEPEPMRVKNAALPAPLGWIVERCLAKNPSDRYASTRDLARDLADVRDHLAEVQRAAAETPVEAQRASRFRRAIWPSSALALAGALVWALVARAPAPELPTYRPLTFQQGVVTGARFALDGKTIYFSVAHGAEPSRIYRTTLDGPGAELLDLPPAILLSVSRRGELAILLTEGRNYPLSSGTLARVDAAGTSPRPLVEGAREADWAPDGEQLVVRRGDESAIEYPIGTPLRRGPHWPRISPAGDRIAWDNMVDGVEIVDLEGKRLLVHPIDYPYGIAWEPRGREIWFTGQYSPGGGAARALYALSLSGRTRLLARAPGALTIFDVSPDGHRALLMTGSSRLGIRAARSDRPGEMILDLYGKTTPVGLTVDGATVLLNENQEFGRGAYLRSTDGAHTVRLGRGVALGLSPDGAWALLADAENGRVTLVPTGTGSAKELALDEFELDGNSLARWSLDGERLFLRLWRANADATTARVYLSERGQPFRPVTTEGVKRDFVVSPDGRTVAARDARGVVTIFSAEGGVPRSLEGETGRLVHWSQNGGWLFLRGPEELPARIYRRELASGRTEPWRSIGPDDATGVLWVDNVLVAGNGEAWVHNFGRTMGDLYLAEGLE